MLGLHDLPTELHTMILPFLDPIALISLSQTDQYFRALVHPKKDHFVQRLLALELVPEHGGGIPTFDAVKDELDLAWEYAEKWKDVQYACQTCVRLRSHWQFCCYSIENPEYRKPLRKMYQTIAVGQWPQRRLPTNQQVINAQENDQTISASYVEQTVQRSAIKEWGTKRESRSCNECQYQAFSRSRSLGLELGHDPAFQPIHFFRYHDNIHRFFPGLFDYHREDDLVSSIFSQTFPPGRPRQNMWLLTMARCSGCSQWQELSAFRQGCSPTNHSIRGNLTLDFEKTLCNKCLAMKVGKRESGDLLLKFWKNVASADMDWLTVGYDEGWKAIFISGFRRHPVGTEYSKLQEEYLTQSDQVFDHQSWPILEDNDAVNRTTLIRLWRDHKRDVLEPSGLWEYVANKIPWLFYFTYECERIVNRHAFLKEWTRRFEEQPQLLVDYALHGKMHNEVPKAEWTVAYPGRF